PFVCVAPKRYDLLGVVGLDPHGQAGPRRDAPPRPHRYSVVSVGPRFGRVSGLTALAFAPWIPDCCHGGPVRLVRGMWARSAGPNRSSGRETVRQSSEPGRAGPCSVSAGPRPTRTLRV